MHRHFSIIVVALGLIVAASPALAVRKAGRAARTTKARKYQAGQKQTGRGSRTKLGTSRSEQPMTRAKARDLVGAALRRAQIITDKEEPFTITLRAPDAAGARHFKATNERRMIMPGAAGPAGAEGAGFIHVGTTVTGTIDAKGAVTIDRRSNPKEL